MLSLFDRMLKRHRERLTEAALNELDDRMLRDIGLDRYRIRVAATGAQSPEPLEVTSSPTWTLTQRGEGVA